MQRMARIIVLSTPHPIIQRGHNRNIVFGNHKSIPFLDAFLSQK